MCVISGSQPGCTSTAAKKYVTLVFVTTTEKERKGKGVLTDAKKVVSLLWPHSRADHVNYQLPQQVWAIHGGHFHALNE